MNKFILLAKEKDMQNDKFDAYLRFGDVDFHKELLCNGEECLGGGFYKETYDGNTLILSDFSADFGKPQFNNEKIDKIYVDSDIYNEFDNIHYRYFVFDDEYIDVKALLSIEE